MADPVTIAAIVSVVGTLASTGAGIAGALSEEKQKKAEAESISLAAKAEETQQRRVNERILAKQRAIGGASGVVSSEGSSLTQLLDNVKEARLDELTIRQQGEQQRQNKLAEARAARGQIGGLIIGGVTDVASSVLGGFIGKKAPGAGASKAPSSFKRVSTTSGFRRGFGVRRPRRLGI